MQRPEKATCCGTCPFLKSNADRPNPNNFVPDPQKGQADWYTQKALDTLWKDGLRHGEPMICHSTNPTGHEHGGPVVAPGNERICTGSLVLQYAHFKAYEAELVKTPDASITKVYSRYKNKAGKMPMTRRGICEFGISAAMGRTGLIGGLPYPLTIAEHRQLRSPSGDTVVPAFTADHKG